MGKEKEAAIEVGGRGKTALPNTTFRVELDIGGEVIARIGGKMRKHRIKIIPGDRVKVDITPYDLRGQHGGSGLLVGPALARAIRTESAATIMYWWGVGAKAVWRWRQAFLKGEGKFRSPGSQAAHQKASRAGAEAVKAKVWTEAELDARAERSKRLGLRPSNRWKEAGEWTWKELDLLGTDTDEAIAARLGRTVNAVRLKRPRRGMPKFREAAKPPKRF